jgi:hypothetical protein
LISSLLCLALTNSGTHSLCNVATTSWKLKLVKISMSLLRPRMFLIFQLNPLVFPRASIGVSSIFKTTINFKNFTHF